jgi:hypothetical protein
MTAAISLLSALALLAVSQDPRTVVLIDDLNESVQARFASPPEPRMLGMSRAMVVPSMGRHYEPDFTTHRDFYPENAGERKVIAALEERQIQVGFYLFGQAILRDGPEALNFRALKGPGAMTIDTPRPAWYPTISTPRSEGSLPDWKAIYPLAQRAMKSFQDGGHGFEASLDSWQILARPVLATQQACLGCHNAPAGLHKPLGGALYAYHERPE